MLSDLKVSFVCLVASDEIDFGEFEQISFFPLARISYKAYETLFFFREPRPYIRGWWGIVLFKIALKAPEQIVIQIC
jgi:hypothetical protein